MNERASNETSGPATGVPTFPMQRFRAPDGLAIAADVAGPENGPTVMMLHGAGQTRQS